MTARIRPTCASIVMAAVLLAAAASPAAADESEPIDPDGLDLGIRLGFALPMGSISGVSSDLSTTFNGLVPLTLEGGRRFNRLYTVGPFFQYGRALVKGGGGSTSDYLFGLQALYRIDAPGPMSPWVGFGGGYEILGAGGGLSVRGFEFATLQAGGEFQPSLGFYMGPFASFSFGEFTTVSSGSSDQDVANPGIHGWLELGLRLDWSL
jgi:hypothetical protein